MEHRLRTDKPVWGEAPGGSLRFYQVRLNSHAPHARSKSNHLARRFRFTRSAKPTSHDQ
jgi:hypothetical protein